MAEPAAVDPAGLKLVTLYRQDGTPIVVPEYVVQSAGGSASDASTGTAQLAQPSSQLALPPSGEEKQKQFNTLGLTFGEKTVTVAYIAYKLLKPPWLVFDSVDDEMSRFTSYTSTRNRADDTTRITWLMCLVNRILTIDESRKVYGVSASDDEWVVDLVIKDALDNILVPSLLKRLGANWYQKVEKNAGAMTEVAGRTALRKSIVKSMVYYRKHAPVMLPDGQKKRGEVVESDFHHSVEARHLQRGNNNGEVTAKESKRWTTAAVVVHSTGLTAAGESGVTAPSAPSAGLSTASALTSTTTIANPAMDALIQRAKGSQEELINKKDKKEQNVALIPWKALPIHPLRVAAARLGLSGDDVKVGGIFFCLRNRFNHNF